MNWPRICRLLRREVKSYRTPEHQPAFDDTDNGNADLLAAGLVYNSERVKNYQPGPTYYSVSQQLVYRVGQYRPRTLATVNETN